MKGHSFQGVQRCVAYPAATSCLLLLLLWISRRVSATKNLARRAAALKTEAEAEEKLHAAKELQVDQHDLNSKP